MEREAVFGEASWQLGWLAGWLRYFDYVRCVVRCSERGVVAVGWQRIRQLGGTWLHYEVSEKRAIARASFETTATTTTIATTTE